jgi:hypothetical protein
MGVPWRWGLGLALGATAGCSLVLDASSFVGSPAAPVPPSDASVDTAPEIQTDSAPPPDAPNVPYLAHDRFEHIETSGFGFAEVGGKWSGGASYAVGSVRDGSAHVRLNAGSSYYNGSLESVKTTDADVELVFSTDKFGSGANGLYVKIIPRDTGAGSYGYAVLVKPDGSISQSLQRNVSSDVTLTSMTPNVNIELNAWYRMRAQAIGVNPTTLRGKFWKADAVEPPWQLETTDPTAQMQGEGFCGLSLYLSSGATNTPIEVRFDEFTARAASLL